MDKIVEKGPFTEAEKQIKVVRKEPAEKERDAMPLNEMKAGYAYALGKKRYKYA